MADRRGMALPLALAALAGVGLGALAPTWQPSWLWPAGLGLLGLLAAGFWRLHGVLLYAVMLLSLAGVHGEREARLPRGLGGVDLSVEARVSEVSNASGVLRLMLDVTRCDAPADLPGCERLKTVRVSVYRPLAVAEGERWAMTLRLRPPRGFRNPGSFDYEAWLWREGIHATGYVRDTPAPERLAGARLELRPWARGVLERRVSDDTARRWLAALTLGDSGALTQDDWDLLNATGTTHLVVISGLHVGLVAAFGLWLGRAAAKILQPLSCRLRAWPWWFAAGCAVAYAGLSGFAPPAVRAMLMTLVGLWALSGRHAPGAWQAWWLALAVIVAGDPLAVWRPGLWLSFLAVAWLIIIWQGRARPRGVRGWLWALGRSQLLLAPMMAAAVVLAFGRVAPAAPLINLLAVPWVSMVLVPVALLGWLTAPLPYIGGLAWWIFAQALEPLHMLLQASLDAVPLRELEHGRRLWLAGTLGLVALCWGLPAVPRAWRLASPGLVVLALGAPPVPLLPEGALRVRVHDVGQGQLIELRTRHSRTLYDTGPRFRSGFTPLDTLWPPGQRFDRVIVSHSDTDHAGGVQALLQKHRVTQWLAPLDTSIPPPHELCRQGQRWQQDGVEFALLWPSRGAAALSANDRSCVLQVTAGEHRVLITGDVGERVERRLLAAGAGPLDLLVAGHHGSTTSSGVQFVRTTSPRHVVFSAGLDNRFGHPADAVVRRFRRQQSCLWSTAHDGAVTFRLVPGEPVVVGTERDITRHGRC